MGTEERDRAVEGRSVGYPEMGAIVTVHAELRRVSERRWVTWRSVPHWPRAGWMVGRRWLQTGYTERGTRPYWGIDGYDPGEPPHWRESGPRTPCILVVYWPTYKPACVPLDGWTPGGGQPRPSMTPWTDADRKVARQAVADQPRDARGRWMKWE